MQPSNLSNRREQFWCGDVQRRTFELPRARASDNFESDKLVEKRAVAPRVQRRVMPCCVRSARRRGGPFAFVSTFGAPANINARIGHLAKSKSAALEHAHAAAGTAAGEHPVAEELLRCVIPEG
jgi:hypothetical protein